MTKYLLLLPALTGCIIVESEKSDREDWNEWDSGWDESDWEDEFSEDEDDWESEEKHRRQPRSGKYRWNILYSS